LKGARLILLGTQVLANPVGPIRRRPGTILAVAQDTITVETGEGALGILDIQPEGRRPMHAQDFVHGHRVATGDTFSAP
jgi:methionyl-tRNA formyltransferase